MFVDHEGTSSCIAQSKDEIASFVDNMAREFFVDENERRAEPRYRMTVQVRVQPIGEGGNPSSAAFLAVTRDLSVSGIGLTSQDPLNGRLIVQLESPNGSKLRALAEVLRCRPNGYYFDVGCKFLCEV